jgi:hypothetical protein
VTWPNGRAGQHVARRKATARPAHCCSVGIQGSFVNRGTRPRYMPTPLIKTPAGGDVAGQGVEVVEVIPDAGVSDTTFYGPPAQHYSPPQSAQQIVQQVVHVGREHDHDARTKRDRGSRSSAPP